MVHILNRGETLMVQLPTPHESVSTSGQPCLPSQLIDDSGSHGGASLNNCVQSQKDEALK